MTRKILIAFLIIIAISIGFITLKTKALAPNISFKDLEGTSFQLSDFKGKPVLVIFWATDCPGCIQEMPELIELHHDYDNTDFEMIGIAMPHDKPEHIKSMRDKKQLPYRLTWDQSGALSQAFDNVRVTPTHFLISPEGEIVMRKIGTLNIDLLKQRLDTMGINDRNS